MMFVLFIAMLALNFLKINSRCSNLQSSLWHLLADSEILFEFTPDTSYKNPEDFMIITNKGLKIVPWMRWVSFMVNDMASIVLLLLIIDIAA